MTTANARKGAETERMVAKYLVKQGFPLADRRLREGRADDQGDIDGVPYTVIQVKYVAKPAMQSWVDDTLKQRDEADAPLCMLVVRVKGQAIGKWSAYMPSSYFIASFEDFGGVVLGDSLGEREAWTWMRMDLRLAAFALLRMTTALDGLSRQSLSTTTSSFPGGTRAPRSVRFTVSGSPPSATT